MIISASRRTDIPAFHADWFLDRIRDGYCCVTNPFNPTQTSRVSLKPDDVDVIVFWTRDSSPLRPYLSELDEKGYSYYFLYTITGYPRELESNTPDLEDAIAEFRSLSHKIGKERVIWRYDPILISDVTSFHYHMDRFAKIMNGLSGATSRVVVSLYDDYRHSGNRLSRLGIKHLKEPETAQEFGKMLNSMVSCARSSGCEMVSCAEDVDLSPYGIKPGKCIDADYIRQVFGIEVSGAKDKNQRKPCGCVQSKDIGRYNTCSHGCAYCYATRK